MTLLDEARRLQAPQGPSCTIGLLLNGDRAAEIAELFADTSIQHTTIVRVLRAVGFETTTQTVGRHRRGLCRCDR